MCSVGYGQGIVYVQPNPQPTYTPVTPQDYSVDIDITGDGNTDFILTSYVNDTVTMTATGSNQLVSMGGYVGNVQFGSSVDSTTAGWSGGTLPLTVVLNLDGPNLSEAGNFAYQTNGYIAFDLVNGANNYYGWMQLQSPVDLGLYGAVVAYAYETSPNISIAVGEVPEPSTFALLLSVACYGVWQALRRVLIRYRPDGTPRKR
jgi:hypothetical protein